MDADELMLWAEHFERKHGRRVTGGAMTIGAMMAKLKSGGARTVDNGS